MPEPVVDILQALDRPLEGYGLSAAGKEQLAGFVHELALAIAKQEADTARAAPPLPRRKTADWPSWSCDRTPGQTPPEFIREHYAPWIGHGLLRRDLDRLDLPLIRALDSWLRTNAMPEDLPLPTIKQHHEAQRIAISHPVVGLLTTFDVSDRRDVTRLGAILAKSYPGASRK